MESKAVEHGAGVAVVAFDSDGFLSMRHILISEHRRHNIGFGRILSGGTYRLVEHVLLNEAYGLAYVPEQQEYIAQELGMIVERLENGAVLGR